MKKIVVLMLSFLFICSSFASAATQEKKIGNLKPGKIKIACVWTGDEALRADNKTEEMVNGKLETKFPQTKYKIVHDNKVYQELLIMAEDKDITNLDGLKKADFVAAGKKFGYDYVMVLPFYSVSWEYTTGFWANSYRVNVALRARIVDVKTEEYLYRQDLAEKGSSSSGFGSPSYLRGQRDGAAKCLDKVLGELEIGEKYSVAKE